MAEFINITAMRDMARSLFAKAIAAADPALAVRQEIIRNPFPIPDPKGKTYLIAIGKAAPTMLQEALQHISTPFTALGITHHDNQQKVDGVRILTAGHPIPDHAGLKAGQEILEMLSKTTVNDQVIALISGGGSALIPAPISPITLNDKQVLNQLLLNSGLDITNMNMVRQQFSELKGGGFLRHAFPALVRALILSDVIGNDLRAVASGPTVAPIGSHQETINLLKQHNIFEYIPISMQKILNTLDEKYSLPNAKNILIGSNVHSLEAMRQSATSWTAKIITDHLVGDVDKAAHYILDASKVKISNPTALIFGGETTVKLQGNGRGGRNQELALRVAILAEKQISSDWVFLSGGTDGRDGPTNAAGGIVDAKTIERIEANKLNVKDLLANNDSYTALNASDDLLITGATGTNVADVQVMLLLP